MQSNKGLIVLILTLLLGLSFVSKPAIAEDESWVARIALKGDFRLRYEGIDEDGEANRDRMRFRARFGLTGKVNEDLKVVLQLATGGSNPVSTNQSFDDGFSTKDIGLDLAYVDWTLNDNVNVYAGKMKNPLFRAGGAPLIWDGDLNPEGFAVKYSNGGFFGTAGVFNAEERSSADDSLLYTLQAGYKFSLSDTISLTAGAGYFAYSDTIGNEPFFNGNAKGNSVDLAGNYINDYKNTELFAQLDTKLNNWPLRIFAHAVQNTEVSQQDTGYAVGAKMGSAKADGDMEFSWTYQDIDADAVIGTFNGSDFGGGGTDADGHIVKAKYAYNKTIFLGGTLFINSVDRFQGVEHDYNRIQLDLEFKFN